MFRHYLIWAVLALFWPGLVQAQTGLTVAQVGIHTREVEPAGVQKVSGAISQALKSATNWTIIDSQAVQTRMASKRGPVQAAIFHGEAEQLLAEARILMEQAEFPQAAVTLDQARESILFYREHLTTQAELIDIHLTLSLLYVGLGEQQKALTELRRVASYNPKLQLDPQRFPPDVIDSYQAIRAEVISSSGSLEVTSTPPGARVYVDGALRGETPVVIQGIPSGEHFIRLEDASNRVDFREVTVDPQHTTPVVSTLRLPNFHLGTSKPFQSLPRDKRGAHVVRVYSVVSQALEVDLVVVAQLVGDFLTLQLYRPSTAQFTVAYQAQVLGPGADTSSAVKGLVKRLAGTLGPDNAIQSKYLGAPIDLDPGQNATLAQIVFGAVDTTGVKVTPSPRDADNSPSETPPADGPESSTWQGNNDDRTPLFRRRWVWAVVGGLVVGAGAGAFMLSDVGNSLLIGGTN